AALLSLDPADRPRAVATRVRSRFLTVAELDLPVTVRAADPGPDGDVRVEVLQTGRAVADIAVTLDTGGPGSTRSSRRYACPGSSASASRRTTRCTDSPGRWPRSRGRRCSGGDRGDRAPTPPPGRPPSP